jgi:hypothetical protein
MPRTAQARTLLGQGSRCCAQEMAVSDSFQAVGDVSRLWQLRTFYWGIISPVQAPVGKVTRISVIVRHF